VSSERTPSWPATRFDGRSAAGEDVRIRVDGATLAIARSDGEERIPLERVEVAERFERAPRMLALPGGATLEVRDAGDAFANALAEAGLQPSWVERMQRAWGAVLVALAGVVALGIWAYVDGIPIAAGHAAELLPASIERSLGESVLELLDSSGALHPSALDDERRARLAERFRLAAAAAGANVRLEFRSGQVNAFALPGGVVVILDELVELAPGDDSVLGVLGHELGHVVHRHSTRQLFQALGVGALAGLAWGDFSTVVANAPIVLGVMRYGRAFELEADAYAIDFLRANRLSPRLLHDFMQRVDPAARESRADELPDFFSTHPSSRERNERLLRAAQAFEHEAE
jgi:Zn-dependent protease with chaperone function